MYVCKMLQETAQSLFLAHHTAVMNKLHEDSHCGKVIFTTDKPVSTQQHSNTVGLMLPDLMQEDAGTN